MNKKIVGIIIGSIIVLVAASLLVLKKQGVDVIKGVQSISRPSLAIESPARYLSANTVMFYSMSDLKELWADITKSRFWEEIKKLRMWNDIGFEENLNKAKSTFEEQFGIKLTESRIMDVLGTRFTFAVALTTGSPDIKVIFQSYISKLGEGFLGAFFEKMSEKAKKTDYNGETIVLIPPETPDAPEVRYVLVNNILTFTFGKAEEEIKTIVDLIKGNEGKSLIKDDIYNSSKKQLGGDENFQFLYYTNFSRTAPMLKDILTPFLEAQPAQFPGLDLKEIAKNLEQIQYIGSIATRSAEFFKMKTYVSPNFDKMNEEQKQLWNKADNALHTIKFAPAASLLFNVTSNFNAGQLWKTVIESTTPAAPAPGSEETAGGAVTVNPLQGILDGIKNFENQYGVNIQKDIIDLMGEELGFVFTGISLEGAFPIPRLGLALQGKDAKALKNKLSELIEKSLTSSGEETGGTIPLKLVKRDIRGSEWSMLETPFGEGLSPVIGAVDSWIILAINSAFAEKMLDGFEGKSETLKSNANYKKISYKEKNSQLTFSDIRGLNQMLKDI
ncbi:MAG: hypothetical protein JW774_03345, partial [Candidatus Aureabacteria bacterium]|nr:hypothetical protein [Candidatus Auribacterota bacterium]